MIEDIEQILADSFTVRVPSKQLHQAAVDIDELARARTLPTYLRLCQLEWQLQMAMVNLATLREEPVAQRNLKEYCEVCEEETSWKFVGYQRDEYGTILFALHNCVKCGASRNLEDK